MGFFSRITESLFGKPDVDKPRQPIVISPMQHDEISRLKEEIDWLAYMTGSDAEFTYGEDGTVQQGIKSQRGPAGIMFSYAWAYTQGLVRPGYFACFCINEAQYRMMRARSRAFCSINPYWHGVQRNLKTHVVGKGHSWILVPKRDDLKVPDEMIGKGQQELDDFYGGYGNARQCYRNVQCEKIERKSRDGEHFLQFIEDNRRLRVRFVEPLLVWTPQGLSTTDNVYFGIKYATGDYEKPERYYVRHTEMLGGPEWVKGASQADPEWTRGIDADDIQHGKANVDKQSPRGIPDTYWVQQCLEQAMRTLKSTGTLVQVRSKIAMIRQRAATLEGSVTTLLSQKGAGKVYGGAPQQRTAFDYPEGGIIDAPLDTTYNFPSQNLEIKEITMAIQAELQSCATSCGLADYMVSGTLGSGASYAASMVSEGPVVKTFEEMQTELIQEDREVAIRCLQTAAKYGRVADNLLDLCDLEMNGPPLARLGIQEAQANQIKQACGVLSTVTWQQWEGLNPARERANEKKYPSPAVVAANAAGQDSGTAQPRNKQGGSARPFSADQEGRQIQRASGATVEEVLEDFFRSRFKESSHDHRSQQERPTAEDIAMAALILTDDWKFQTKAEILALPNFAHSPRESNMKVDLEPGIQGIYLGIVDKQKVYAVDPTAIMVKYNCADFVVAGNSMKWKGIVPDDLIYIDHSYNAIDAAHDCLHECGEFRLEQAGWSYPRAHKYSNWGPDMEMDWILVLRPDLKALAGTGVTEQTEKDQTT